MVMVCRVCVYVDGAGVLFGLFKIEGAKGVYYLVFGVFVVLKV